MALYVQVRKSDDLVVSLAGERTATQVAGFPAGADTKLVEITKAQFDVANQGLFHDGSAIPKWRWADPNFVENPDTRPVVTFTPDNIKAEINEVVSVTIDHSGGINGTKELLLASVPTRVDFVAGQATMAVDTSRAVQFIVLPQEQFAVAAPLEVTVFSRKIGPKP